MGNGKKKNGKQKPKVIDTGDSFPIIDDEKDISDNREVARHGWKVSEGGEYLGRWPTCPFCKKYIEKLKIRGVDVDLLDRGVVSEKGKLNFQSVAQATDDKPKVKDETIITRQSIQPPKERVFSMKNLKYLGAGVVILIIGFFAYRYFANREGQRLDFPVVITNFQETGGYFTIEGTIENNVMPVEARAVAKFYDGFGKVVFIKRFPKQFFNTGISPLFLSVKNHKGVSEVEIWLEK